MLTSQIMCMLLINSYFVLNCSAVSCKIQQHRANINSKNVSSCEIWDATGPMLVHTSLPCASRPVYRYLLPRSVTGRDWQSSAWQG